MSKLKELVKHLRCGKIYRRLDFEQWSSAVDCHIGKLLEEGTPQKFS